MISLKIYALCLTFNINGYTQNVQIFTKGQLRNMLKYILLIVSALFVLLFVMPIHIRVSMTYYNSKLQYEIRFFGIKLNIKIKSKKKFPLPSIADSLYLINQIHVRKFKLHILCGCDDAAYDVIIAQLMRNIVCIIYILFNMHDNNTQTDINIVPAFNQTVLRVNLDSIFVFKIGYIIYAISKILLNAKTKNSLRKAN